MLVSHRLLIALVVVFLLDCHNCRWINADPFSAFLFNDSIAFDRYACLPPIWSEVLMENLKSPVRLVRVKHVEGLDIKLVSCRDHLISHWHFDPLGFRLKFHWAIDRAVVNGPHCVLLVFKM